MEFQKIFSESNLKTGNKYTIFSLGEFGFPVAMKITLTDFYNTSYAQYSDAVKLVYRPKGKRNDYYTYFYKSSVAIFEGWQDLPESVTYNVKPKNNGVVCKMSKYCCFDSRFFEDGLNAFINPVLIIRDYKTGANGTIYA